MLRQILLMLGLCLFSYNAIASEDTTSEGKKKTFQGSPLTFGLDIQYYAPAYKKYAYAVDNGVDGTSSEAGKAGQVSLEWLPLGNKIGKLGIGVSSGFVAISDFYVQTSTEIHHVNFNVIPSQAFLSYRLDYFENQIIVPFAKVGASANWIRLSLDRNETNQMSYGFDYSFGGELCLNFLEPRTGREFDSRFGVNGTYILVEYIKSDQLNKTSPINLAYDAFRFGMRFEF